MREPQPHSHERPMDENEVPRNACTRARKPRQWHMQCNGTENDIQACQWDFSTEMWGKTAPKWGENTPDAWNSPETWTFGTRNGLQLYKACIIGTWNEKTEARQPQNKHFYSLWHGQSASKDGAKMAYKNGPKHAIMKQLTAANSK